MLMIYGNDAKWNSIGPDDLARVAAETDALHVELQGTGEFVAAYGVADQANARTVNVSAGVPAVTDGPYMETKECLGSFTIIDVESFERACEVAARNPAARLGGIEVLPIMHEHDPEL